MKNGTHFKSAQHFIVDNSLFSFPLTDIPNLKRKIKAFTELYDRIPVIKIFDTSPTPSLYQKHVWYGDEYTGGKIAYDSTYFLKRDYTEQLEKIGTEQFVLTSGEKVRVRNVAKDQATGLVCAHAYFY